MEFDKAKSIGDEAERRVSETLNGLQAEFGFVMLDDVLIGSVGQRGSVTAQIDHVLIDQFGVLLVETKARNGALIKGTYAEKNWTACYPGRRNYAFQNPLHQNDQHIHLLHKLLKQKGFDHSLDRIRGLVVMAGCDTSQLELDSITASRVADIGEIRERLRMRHDFVIQAPLTEDERAALTQAIFELDQSANDSLTKVHADHRSGQGSAATAPAAARAATPPRTGPARGATASPAKQPSGSTGVSNRRLVAAGAVLALIVFVGWGLKRMLEGTSPLWVVLAILALAIALGGEEKKTRRRRSGGRRQRGPSPPQDPLAALKGLATAGFMMLVFLGVALWFLGSGARAMSESVFTGTSPGASAQQANVQLAKDRIREAEPDIYARITNADTPKVTSDGTNVSYEWTYVVQPAASEIEIRSIRVTLDPSGRIIGVATP